MSLYLLPLHAAVDFPLFRGDSSGKYFAQHNAEAFERRETVANTLIHIMRSEIKAHS